MLKQNALKPVIRLTGRVFYKVVLLLYKEYILENNLTIVYECLNHLKSVSFGVWIGVGSRNETRQNNGISHFIEHMLFKGTKTRTAKDIACSIDKIGGEINAFTGKDCTCFYTKTLDSDLETAVEILSDMILNPVFNPVHIETEKKSCLKKSVCMRMIRRNMPMTF